VTLLLVPPLLRGLWVRISRRSMLAYRLPTVTWCSGTGILGSRHTEMFYGTLKSVWKCWNTGPAASRQRGVDVINSPPRCIMSSKIFCMRCRQPAVVITLTKTCHVNKVCRVSYRASFLLEARPAAPRSLFLGENNTGVQPCVCVCACLCVCVINSNVFSAWWLLVVTEALMCASCGLLLCWAWLSSEVWDKTIHPVN